MLDRKDNLTDVLPDAHLSVLDWFNRVCSILVIGSMVTLGLFATSRFVNIYSPPSASIEVPFASGSAASGTAQSGPLDPQRIKESIGNQAQSIFQSLDRPQQVPLWVWLKIGRSDVDFGKPVIYDLRMLRAQRYSLWLVPVDSVARPRDISDAVVQGEGGLYIELPATGFAYDIVGEIHSSYSWKPAIKAWHSVSLVQLKKDFTKTGSSLYVVFLALAAISLCIALVNRSRLFVVFSGWLIASIMITGFNYGWDFAWLGITYTGAGFSLGLMTTTLSAYGFLSGFLFLSIFGQQLKDSRIYTALQLCIAGFFLLVFIGLLAPLSVFMTLVWGNGLFGILCITLGLVHAIGRGSRRLAWLYASSYALLALGVTGEIFYQIGLFPDLRNVVSAAGSSIASAVVMSVTLAVQFRDERSARMLAQQGEIDALRRLEGVYARSPVGLFSLGADGKLNGCNLAFEKLFETGEKLTELPRFENLWNAGLRTICETVITSASPHSEEICLSTSDGQDQWFVVRLAPGNNGFDGSISNISWRKQAEQKLSLLATNDPITGALNQNGLNSALQAHLDEPQNSVFCKLALDHFAYILRIQGFEVGDKILLILVKEIELALPSAQTARIGDSVFILIGNTTLEDVKTALETRLSRLTETGVVIGDIVLPANFSAGLCRLDGCEDPTEANTRVNLAYETAVEKGQQCAVITDDQSVDAIRRLDAVRSTRKPGKSADMGRFFLMAQPVINMQSLSAPISFELLLRMRGDDGKIIVPAQFMPAAEKVGLMSTLDRFVFNEVIRLVESGELPIYRMEHISINLSGSSLNDPSFLDDFYHQVASSKVDATHFCFEVTESVALNSFEQTKTFLTALRALGARTAIDDFGAGHSSIHYLTELAPDYLKLDGSLVRNMLANSIHHSFMQKMVQLAHEMEVQCIAEFVESQASHKALSQMGVSYAQGYLYSPPIEISEAANFCKRWQASHSVGGIQLPGMPAPGASSNFNPAMRPMK